MLTPQEIQLDNDLPLNAHSVNHDLSWSLPEKQGRFHQHARIHFMLVSLPSIPSHYITQWEHQQGKGVHLMARIFPGGWMGSTLPRGGLSKRHLFYMAGNVQTEKFATVI